ALGVFAARPSLLELGQRGHVIGARPLHAHLAQPSQQLEAPLPAFDHLPPPVAGRAAAGTSAGAGGGVTGVASSRSRRSQARARDSVSVGACARNCSSAGLSCTARSTAGVVPARYAPTSMRSREVS